ncbi:helix-turn-helix transcriptional regulator [Paenibacillus pedocola]|uniref:helix-turn-helix transcriptional regulator n=1 Tax=Paenibacillus pedocola TaxID=3242193 RepID=UPI0028775BBA|nr:helix-turn-helix transcriptional regulator [Paenibacillus typhae]
MEQQIEFAIPFVQQLAENVTDKWMNQNIDLQKYRLDMIFGEYKLTAREKDVASLWLSEKSALHISSELGISEGSVRNVVKSIYFKMNVNDRWQFTKKLIH